MNTKLYDFYFSQSHKAHLERINAMSFEEDEITPCFFKGEEYTEAITHGEIPITAKNFPDIKLVGTGTFDDCSFVQPTR